MSNTARKRKLKRAVVITLLVLLVFSLAGCGAKKEEIPVITTLDELNGHIAVMRKGAVYSALLTENSRLQDVESLYTLNNSDALAMLLAGKADAFLTDDALAQTLVNKYDGLRILDESLDEASYGFAFRKGDLLQEQFSEVIRRMKADGSLEAMAQKWLGSDESLKTVPEQDWPGTNGTLDCFVAPEMEPICYVQGTDVVGLDVDLLLACAKELDYHMTFTTHDFYDMLPSLMAGRTNIVASAITITEERAENVDFTEDYLNTSAVVLVRTGESSTKAGFLVSVIAGFDRVFVQNDHWKDLLLGLGRTIALVLLTVAGGTLLGGLMFLWGYTQKRVARVILSASGWIMTMLPMSTWLMIVYYVVFSGRGRDAFAAAAAAFTVSFAFGVYGALRGSTEALPAGQTEAAYSMGYSRFRTLRRILLPQALPGFLADMEETVIYHIRDTSLVGMITVLDIQAVADLIRAETMDPFLSLAVTAVAYILLAWGASSLVRRLRLSSLFADKTEQRINERIKKGKL